MTMRILSPWVPSMVAPSSWEVGAEGGSPGRCFLSVVRGPGAADARVGEVGPLTTQTASGEGVSPLLS